MKEVGVLGESILYFKEVSIDVRNVKSEKLNKKEMYQSCRYISFLYFQIIFKI